MNSISVLIVLSITISVVFSECPAPEELFPCKCLTNAIQCVGNEAKSLITLKKLGSTNFKSLNLENTLITAIEDNSLGNATFDTISISNNTLLETIDKNVLNKTQAKEILINSNIKLKSDSILSFIKTLEVTEKLDIINTNTLVEIPVNAFQTNSNKSKLSSINLSDNKISKLGSNAFNNLPNLTNLLLKNNLIEKLDDNCLTFANMESMNNQKISVNLANNKLTEKSFTKTTFVTEDHISIELNLDNNSMTTLSEENFKNFLANNKNQLMLNNNKFLCNCNMKWILDNSQKLKSNINNLKCSNKDSKNLFDLSIADLNCETKASTTPKPTPIPMSKCPDNQLVTPCVCGNTNIECDGRDIKQLPLKGLTNLHFSSLRIFNTSIVTIDDNSLGNATFEEVYIENNALLDTISDKVFATQPLQLFMINNGNYKLKSNSIFSMFRNLQMTEEIEFNNNDIIEIPENAFTPKSGTDSKLFDINLKDNAISKIGSNAFSGLNNLVDIQLQNNNLTTIENWLNFNPNPNRIRNIMLENNRLTSNSFSYLKSEENVFIRLFLENNLITKFPENIFSKFFTNNQNEVHLEGNKFECDCIGMKWILDNSLKLIKLINDLHCINIDNRNVFSLTKSDLNCTEVNTTTVKY